MEHNAVMRPLHAIGAEIHVAGKRLFDSDALLAELERLLTPDTKLCVMTHVSNVFGWQLPVEDAAELCKKRGIPFVLDAAQSAGCLDVDMQKLGAAFIAMPGHKGLMGPQGTGLLLCGRETKTLLEGGTGSISARWRCRNSCRIAWSLERTICPVLRDCWRDFGRYEVWETGKSSAENGDC